MHKVLVVDDYPDAALWISDLLGNAYEVDLFYDSAEALQAILAGQYDCVVSDGKMPGLSGPELMRATLAQKPEMANRFVFVTGTPFDTMRELEEIGQAKVLFKPAYKGDLLEAVGKACSAC